MRAENQIDIFGFMAEQPKTEERIIKKKENIKHLETSYIEENKKILKRYRMQCKSKGLTGESLKAIIGNDLRLFLDFIGNKSLNSVTHNDIQDFLLYCEEDRENGDEALARKFTSLNTFFKTLIIQEVIHIKNPLDKLQKPKVRKKERNFLTYEEYQQILNYLDNSKEQNRIRDAALISFFFASGCRLTEVYQQNRDNLDFQNRRFKVLGKGEKERICFFTKDAAIRIRRYLMTRNDNNPALFISRQKNRLAKKSIQDAVKRIGVRAGVKKNCHAHLLRHTRAMYLLKQGAKLETIQRVLGHSNISTTQIYAHINVDEVQDEVAMIDGDM